MGEKYGYGGLILHALSYFGFSALEIVGHLGGGDVASLHSLQGGFGLPVHPGGKFSSPLLPRLSLFVDLYDGC